MVRFADRYFHYLTKWMHALDQASRSAGRPELNLWARELARTAHAGFSYSAPGERRMYWKMSIDLTRPLVRAMGQHDALDGYITCLQLEATASALGVAGPPDLRDAIRDFASMLSAEGLPTTDPLGIGGLLEQACRAEQLHRNGALRDGGALVDALVRAAVVGLERCGRSGELGAPAEQRLAFRELGLAIGLHGAALLQDAGGGGSQRRALLDALRRHDGLREEARRSRASGCSPSTRRCLRGPIIATSTK